MEFQAFLKAEFIFHIIENSLVIHFVLLDESSKSSLLRL